MAKILRKSYENNDPQFPKLSVFLAKNRYFITITFKILKMEFKFESTGLTTRL